jgi:hypothetical protein
MTGTALVVTSSQTWPGWSPQMGVGVGVGVSGLGEAEDSCPSLPPLLEVPLAESESLDLPHYSVPWLEFDLVATDTSGSAPPKCE